VHLACRRDDEHLEEARTAVELVITADEIAHDPGQAARAAREIVAAAPAGYWLHLDVDVLDPEVMAAVDSPAPGGLQPAQLITMLDALAPGAVGGQVTVLDPDLDPDGRCATTVCRVLVEGLGQLGAAQRRRSTHPRANPQEAPQATQREGGRAAQLPVQIVRRRAST
jgi:arginase